MLAQRGEGGGLTVQYSALLYHLDTPFRPAHAHTTNFVMQYGHYSSHVLAGRMWQIICYLVCPSRAGQTTCAESRVIVDTCAWRDLMGLRSDGRTTTTVYLYWDGGHVHWRNHYHSLSLLGRGACPLEESLPQSISTGTGSMSTGGITTTVHLHWDGGMSTGGITTTVYLYWDGEHVHWRNHYIPQSISTGTGGMSTGGIITTVHLYWDGEHVHWRNHYHSLSLLGRGACPLEESLPQSISTGTGSMSTGGIITTVHLYWDGEHVHWRNHYHSLSLLGRGACPLEESLPQSISTGTGSMSTGGILMLNDDPLFTFS